METTVRAGNDTIWVEDSGGDGPVAVLLHPGVADSRSWDLVWPALAEQLRVIRYDARGYGRSPRPTEQYRHLDDLTAVLDQRGVTSAHLVGCSMGGANAIDLALASPGRVISLTLLCPGVTGYPWPAEPELNGEASAAAEAGEDALLAISLREWAAAGGGPEVVEMMRSAVRAWPSEERFAKDAEPAFDRLGELNVPAVLMVGDRDRPALIACNEAMVARIRGCELIRLPGVDHLPAVREPALVTQTILRQCGTTAQPSRATPPASSLPAKPGHGRRHSLRIAVLGSLTVNGQAGALAPAQSQLVVALALNRGGLSNGQLCRLLGADDDHPKPADSLRQLITRTRRALGQAPVNREWIEHLGHGHYALHPDAWVDLPLFETLTAAGIGQGEAPPLADALSLVRGRPFAGCYYWWLEPERIESVTTRVIAAAEALATLRLADRDPAAAARAARIGLAADSSAEQLWRVVMRAEHAAGNLAGVRGAWSRCLNVASEVAADGRPDSATCAVYRELLAR